MYREPVESIEVEVRGYLGLSAEWTSVDPEIYQLPDGYGDAFSIFVVDCDCSKVRVHAFAADGRQIGISGN